MKRLIVALCFCIILVLLFGASVQTNDIYPVVLIPLEQMRILNNLIHVIHLPKGKELSEYKLTVSKSTKQICVIKDSNRCEDVARETKKFYTDGGDINYFINEENLILYALSWAKLLQGEIILDRSCRLAQIYTSNLFAKVPYYLAYEISSKTDVIPVLVVLENK